jgi:ubiquinone/menaquinone biosynthesis C-methylase UbiE
MVEHSLYESDDAGQLQEGRILDNSILFRRYLWAVDKLKGRSPTKIIDAACGRGYGSNTLSQIAHVTGVDICSETVAYAKQHYGNPNINFVQGNIESNDFWMNCEDGSIDAIVSFETLEHCNEPQKALANFKRALRNEGTLLLSVPNGIYERKNKDGKSYDSSHLQLFSPDDIYSLVSNEGFKQIEIYGQGAIYGMVMGYLRKMIYLLKGEKSERLVNLSNRSKSHGNLSKIRDLFFQLTGLMDVVTKPRKMLYRTADKLIIEARK